VFLSSRRLETEDYITALMIVAFASASMNTYYLLAEEVLQYCTE